MRKRRRIAILAALLAVAALLVLAPAALAGAGGGSSGFSGGGEGGGGGGGRGAGFYILIQILIRIAILGHGLGAIVLVGLVLLALLYTRVVAPRARNFAAAQESTGRNAKRRTQHRERRVELAAAEAADDDPSFAPDVVRPAAAKLFKDIQAAWDGNDRAALRALISSDLAKEWELRLDDFARKGWRNRVQIETEPAVRYVGLQNRGDDAADRVVVRIEAMLRDYVEDRSGAHIKRVGRLSEQVNVREYWTLGKRAGRWILLSIEQGAEGSHALEEQVVATPWSDEQGLRDEALIEGAVAEAVPHGTEIAEVADLDFRGDARAAALDLSLADGRFAPDVLSIAARRAVAAWVDAIDGSDAGLARIAEPAAIRELLHPGDPSGQTRLVVRGLQVEWIRITGLDPAAHPPEMTIEVDLHGRRYIEDRDTAAVLSGSRSQKTRFTERWTLALDGDAAQPWRIAAVGG